MKKRLALILLIALTGPVAELRAQQTSFEMPSVQTLANADRFVPPKLGELAAKLAVQPDMTGTWTFVQPRRACRGPLFDPPNSVCPPQPPEGEATFGPAPGTYMTSIPYTAEYKKIYERHVKEAMDGKARDTFAACVPYGVPRMVGESPSSFDIVQAPEIMIWHNVYGRTERRVFLDGRGHPKGDEMQPLEPSYSGHSVGRWEGNVLIIETVDMIPAFFDETAAPHSAELRMVEKLRLVENNLLENEITLTDRIAFEKPWVVKRYYRRGESGGAAITHGYLDLNDRPCVANVRLDEQGFQVMLLPQELEAEQARVKALLAGKAVK